MHARTIELDTDICQTSPMWLVYVDSEGIRRYQPWDDVVYSGTAIDPVTGDDMSIVGWTIESPDKPTNHK